MKKWKKISSKYALNNPWMMVRQDTVELPNGKIVEDFLVYEQGDVVMIIPVTENGEFVFVKQYKHAADEIVIEFPAGYINKDETEIEAAKRELKEETGYSNDDVSLFTTLIKSPSKVVSTDYIFLALNSKQIFDQKENQDENENIEILILSFEKAHEMIKNGEIKISSTVAAFYLASEKLGYIK